MLLRLMPTDGYFTRDDLFNMTEFEREQYLIDIGVKGNPFVLFGKFFVNLFQGDLGEVLRVDKIHKPIVDLLAERVPYSLAFGGVSMVISMALGFFMGISMAKNKDKLPDLLGTGYVVAVRAIPSLIYLFFIQVYFTRWFGIPMTFSDSNPATWVLPVISLSLSSIAWYAVWLRRFMVDEENRDYVKFARAKGLSERKIMNSHILRNALVPLVQYFPTQLLLTISGSLVIESLYSIPGMGGLLVKAIQEMDNNVVQILVLLFSILGIVGVFLGDIAMAIIDPRIQLTSSSKRKAKKEVKAL
ncbi:MAG: ABC transporter permease [Clostridia bacterium]